MADNSNVLVMLVDDEPDILELINDEFDFADFKTVTATCGNEAIALLNEHKVNVVISDYKMPNGTGMDLLNAVNQLDSSNRPIFYFVSGQADVSEQEAIDAGAKKFFSKPFDLAELITEVETLGLG